MLLARYAPVGSQRYKKLAQTVKLFDKVIERLPAQLFGIWSIFVAGMAAGKAQADRFYFWDWNDWLIGVIGIFVITLIFTLIKNKLKISELDEIDWMKNSKDRIFYLLIGIILFLVGWFSTNQSIPNSISNFAISYWIYLGVVLVPYHIKTENDIIYDLKAKLIHITVAIILLVGGIWFGFINDDPVIATASIVSLPFFIVLLFGKHIRHLERAKFYPIFIFSMFVVSREGWFLIPLLFLFFILRSYNYLRYQKVFPTFGVTDDQS